MQRKSYISGQNVQYTSKDAGDLPTKQFMSKRAQACSWPSALCQVTVGRGWKKPGPILRLPPSGEL